MVEISLSGSGEGPGRVTGRGYSTAAFRAIMHPISPDLSTSPWLSGPVRGEAFKVEGEVPGVRRAPLGRAEGAGPCGRI